MNCASWEGLWRTAQRSSNNLPKISHTRRNFNRIKFLNACGSNICYTSSGCVFVAKLPQQSLWWGKKFRAFQRDGRLNTIPLIWIRPLRFPIHTDICRILMLESFGFNHMLRKFERIIKITYVFLQLFFCMLNGFFYLFTPNHVVKHLPLPFWEFLSRVFLKSTFTLHILFSPHQFYFTCASAFYSTFAIMKDK